MYYSIFLFAYASLTILSGAAAVVSFFLDMPGLYYSCTALSAVFIVGSFLIDPINRWSEEGSLLKRMCQVALLASFLPLAQLLVLFCSSPIYSSVSAIPPIGSSVIGLPCFAIFLPIVQLIGEKQKLHYTAMWRIPAFVGFVGFALFLLLFRWGMVSYPFFVWNVVAILFFVPGVYCLALICTEIVMRVKAHNNRLVFCVNGDMDGHTFTVLALVSMLLSALLWSRQISEMFCDFGWATWRGMVYSSCTAGVLFFMLEWTVSLRSGGKSIFRSLLPLACAIIVVSVLFVAIHYVCRDVVCVS